MEMDTSATTTLTIVPSFGVSWLITVDMAAWEGWRIAGERAGERDVESGACARASRARMTISTAKHGICKNQGTIWTPWGSAERRGAGELAA